MNKTIYISLKLLGLICLFFIAGCKKDDTENLEVGMTYQGGIIFYFDATKQHGLIAASEDQEGTYTWQQALTVCDELILNGYDDWYLPSNVELDRLYLKKDIIGGFTDDIYWSSTEHNHEYARGQRFSNGRGGATLKSNNNKVRAIRAF